MTLLGRSVFDVRRRTYTHVYTFTRIHTLTYVPHTHMYTHPYVYTLTRTHTDVYTHVRTPARTLTHTHVHVRVHICVRIYVCTDMKVVFIASLLYCEPLHYFVFQGPRDDLSVTMSIYYKKRISRGEEYLVTFCYRIQIGLLLILNRVRSVQDDRVTECLEIDRSGITQSGRSPETTVRGRTDGSRPTTPLKETRVNRRVKSTEMN